MGLQKPSNFPFELSQVPIVDQRDKGLATVLTPKNAMVFDWNKLNRIKVATGLSPVEQWIVERAAREPDNAGIIILRAVNSAGQRVWLFDPGFDNETLAEAGYVLTKALLPFHRALAKAGVVLMVHSDWGDRESYGLRHGVWRCIDEMSQRTEPGAESELDLWVVKNMVHHMSLPLDHVVKNVLPPHLAMIRRRSARAQSVFRTKPGDPA
jgi:hypothetical protein